MAFVFRTLIKLLKSDPRYDTYFRTRMRAEMDNTNKEGIADNLGLCASYAWWRLAFRTANGAGAHIFIALIRGSSDWRNMNVWQIRNYIKNSTIWTTPLGWSQGVGHKWASHGCGPWIPQDDPDGPPPPP